MSIFPKVGTVYPSLSAFKLDTFERGLHHSINLTTKTASPNVHQHTYCALKIGPNKKYCNFRAIANNVHGIIKVVDVSEEHTCSATAREANQEQARKIMISKVEKLKKQIQEAERGEVVNRQVKRKRLERSRADSSPEYEVAEEEDTASEDEDDGDFDQSESEAELGSSTARRKRQRASNASKLLAKTLFPPIKDLQVEIARLKMSGHVSLPSQDEPFNTARDLLITLHAFAQQSGFSIFRHSPLTETSKLVMVCTRRASRYLQEEHGCSPQVSTSVYTSHPQLRAPKRPVVYYPSSIKPYPSDLISFVRSFDSVPSTLDQTLSALSSIGVGSLERLTLISMIPEQRFERVAKSIDGELRKKLEEIAISFRIAVGAKSEN
ncbi:hypothetical protein JCM5350_005967 [Sporobolomyces pararoseus]